MKKIEATTMYSRQLQLSEIGLEGQNKLEKAKVLVIGAGGLGCPILQYLVGTGVGTIGIVDGDVVSLSNLHRQILYGVADVGKPKVNRAAMRLHQLNPLVKIETYFEFLSTTNALQLFKQYDIIVDGSDNFATRYLVNDAAVLTNKPVVMGSVFQFEGQVTVYNYQNGPTYRCLYPESPEEGSVPNCSEIGVVGVLPGIIGCMQANEVIKLICGYGQSLSGSLWVFNAKSHEQYSLSFSKNEDIVITNLLDNYSIGCETIQEIALQKAIDGNYTLLDVRTLEEHKEFHLEGLHIPLQQLEDRYKELEFLEKGAVYCKTGKRSRKAVALLQQNLPEIKWVSILW